MRRYPPFGIHTKKQISMNYDHYDLVQDLYYNFATVEGVEDEFLIAIRHIAKDLESAHPAISGKIGFFADEMQEET